VKLKIKYIKSSIKESGNIIGHFILTNLNTGQGLTIGNALRRVLLSNIEGTAITAIKIPNTSHEFSTIPGIREDILEILLNLKQIVLKTTIKNKISGKIYAQGPGIITGSCLKFDDNVEIVNPNQYIGTITTNQKIEFDILVEPGIGYHFGNQAEQKYKNFLNIDAIFMPVVNVNFKINNVYLSYNKTEESLALDITTNGSLTPEKALSKAAQQLMEWFGDLTNEENLKPENKNVAKQISDLKSIRIEELNLSVRAYNCLKRSGIQSVSDLLQYSKEDFNEIKSFGKKSADEIFQVLKKKYNIIIPSLKY
jgi:DNA-directed RNA polymerase subunit alpha